MTPFWITEDKSPAATFSLRFSSGSSAGFYVLAPPREVSQADERARIQAMPVEPGMASVRFRLFFNGKPLRHVPDGPVHVSLFDLKAQRPTTQLARMVNGVVEVPTVPTGVYRAYVIVQTVSGAVSGEPGLGLPGDYVGDLNEVALETAGASPVMDLPVGRFMHLVSKRPSGSLSGCSRLFLTPMPLST